jgi:hypothetical protein
MQLSSISLSVLVNSGAVQQRSSAASAAAARSHLIQGNDRRQKVEYTRIKLLWRLGNTIDPAHPPAYLNVHGYGLIRRIVRQG